jgi:glutaconate CoA-transferase subunit B
MSGYTRDEMMTAAAARRLWNGCVCFVGIGLPSAACNLARLTHAPDIVLIYESGTIGARPNVLPLSIGDGELAETAACVVPLPEVFSYLLQAGRVDVGFLGAAQIDRFGNLNSSFIGDADNPKIRLPGTGGGNDISSLTNMIVAMKHEKRRFVGEVDFITSPGWLEGRRTRERAGLPQGGMWRVVTDLAIMGFDEDTREMKVLALHQGVTREQVQDNTGFELLFDKKLETAEPPRKDELDVLRHLDPERLYTT